VTDKDRQEHRLQSDFESGANKADWIEQKIFELSEESYDSQVARIRQTIEDNPFSLRDEITDCEITLAAHLKTKGNKDEFLKMPEVFALLSYAIEKEAEEAWKALREAE